MSSYCVDIQYVIISQYDDFCIEGIYCSSPPVPAVGNLAIPTTTTYIADYAFQFCGGNANQGGFQSKNVIIPTYGCINE